MTVLVVGATGHVGAEVTAALLDAGVEVRAASRRGRAVGTAVPVALDLGDRGAAAEHWAGVDAVFLLGGLPDTPGLLADMRAAGVTRVVFLSTGAVVGGDLDNAVTRMGMVGEAAVRDSGLSWTVLRPSGFMSNTLQWRAALAAGDLVTEPFADVAIAVIDPADIAAVATRALTEDGHDRHSYRLTGADVLRPTDRLRILGEVLDRDLRLHPEPDADAYARMSAGMGVDMADAFFRFFRHGEYDDSIVDDTVARLLGRRPRTFREWAAAHADAFRAG